MTNSNQTTKESAQPSPELTREQNQKLFRQYLRQADKCIIEHRFDDAKVQITEAKKIDASNPFIIAFEERIALFEQKKNPKHFSRPVAVPVTTPVEENKTAPAPVVVTVPEHSPASREMIEEKLRHEVEAEYRAKFTHELRKAEEHAAKILLEERAKLEEQRHSVKRQYEEQLSAARKHVEEEFQQKLTEEITKVEKKLEQQYKSELSIIEAELKKQLAEHHDQAMRQLEERVRKEEQTLLEQERKAFKEREQKYKEESDKKLLEALRKTESVFREQTVQQQQLDKEQLRQQITSEVRERHEKELEQLRQQFDAAKASLQESFHAEQKRLSKENERITEERLEGIRKKETEEFEQKRSAIRAELELELQKKYDERLAGEVKRIEHEGVEVLERERKKLEEEYKTLLQSQNDKVQTVRTELRAEMEKVFLNKLQRVADEYDHKMALLGATVPEAKEDRVAFYREKMKSCYGEGQPSVENARMLMELKELLELTFDEHLAIEADVRLDLYVQHVEKKILSGEVKLYTKDALDSLKLQFGITAEESAKLEPYIISSFQRQMTKGRLLVVDDDLLLLQTLELILSEHGFQVITAEDISTALEKLQTTAFDFILSDIKFEYDELDGFKLFKAVQEQPQLRNIPFVFMSSLEDGVIIRSGMQLGIDDYLTKPMDPDLLFAVIEGKIKRFKNFQKN